MRPLPLACLSILAAALLTAPGCGGDEADTSTQGTSSGPGGPGTTTGSGGSGAGMTTGGGGSGQGGSGQGGSGLGTHIIYNLVVQLMKGRISCDSEVGLGAHFQIRLPLEKETAQARA